MGLKEWGNRWYDSRKRLFGKLRAGAGRLWDKWWRNGGKDQIKTLVAGAWGEFWPRVESQAIATIRAIRDKEIEVPDGETYESVYLKVLVPKVREMLDANNDGSIDVGEIVDRIPRRWWNRTLEVGLGIVENVDGDMADDLGKLAEAFRGIDPQPE